MVSVNYFEYFLINIYDLEIVFAKNAVPFKSTQGMPSCYLLSCREIFKCILLTYETKYINLIKVLSL